MSVVKWWLSVLLAVLACLQIARGAVADTDAAAAAAAAAVQFPDLYEASVLELQAGLDAGHFSSVDLVKVRVASVYLVIFIFTDIVSRRTLPVSTK